MLKPSLQLKLGQQLTMTPQLQQAIRLLQLPALELQAHIRELLETQRDARAHGGSRGHRHLRGGRDTSRPSTSRRESRGRARPGEHRRGGRRGLGRAERRPRRDPLERRRRRARSRSSPTPPVSRCRSTCCGSWSWRSLAPRELAIARAIVDAISDDGYLTESLEEIAQHAAPGDRVRRRGGRSRARGRAGARSARRRRALGRRVHRAAAAAARSGDPRIQHRASRSRATTSSWSPSASCRCCGASCAPPRRRSPVPWRWCAPAIRAPAPPSAPARPSTWFPTCSCGAPITAGRWKSTPPRCRACASISSYASLIGRNASHATMRAQLQEARWLLKSLEIRHETLIKVARSIVERQTAFLEHGDEHMRPMILKDIAEAVEHARVDHLARHLRQVHAHAARRVRAALLLLQPGRRRRRLGHLLDRHPRQDPQARQGGRRRRAP